MRRILLALVAIVLVLAPMGAASLSAGEIILTNQPWVCSSAVDLDLVKVTMHPNEDAVVLASGCSGRVGRIEVDTWTQDGIKVQNASANAAHDLVIQSGMVVCHDKAGGAHQDGIQVMGGRNITFRNLYIGGCDTQGLFINKAGSGATTPTNIVFEFGKVGLPSPSGGPATPVNINIQNGSQIRDSIVCRSPRFGNDINTHGSASASVRNTILPVGNPGCAPSTTPPPPPPPPPSPPPPPAQAPNLSICQQWANKVKVCWPALLSVTRYNYYRDTTFLSHTLNGNTVNVMFGLVTGTHAYGVEAVYANGGQARSNVTVTK